MLRFPFGLLVLLLCTLLLPGCYNGNKEDIIQIKPGEVKVRRTFDGNHPIKVVCTTGMVADLVRNVGGKHVKVTQLMASNVDPHLYEAGTEDIAKLKTADLIVYNGLHLEGKMADTLHTMGTRSPAFAVANYLPADRVRNIPKEGLDPHIWFDVSLWNEAREGVQKVLSKFDPKHAGDYAKQGRAYGEKLEELHKWTKTKLARIPKEQRVLITAHDAFEYFGKAYDVDVRGIQGISTESEASIKHRQDLVKLIVDNKIKAVFVETSVNEENVKNLIEACKVRKYRVEEGGTLYSDAMGDPGSSADTYIGMVRHNVNTIVAALK